VKYVVAVIVAMAAWLVASPVLASEECLSSGKPRSSSILLPQSRTPNVQPLRGVGLEDARVLAGAPTAIVKNVDGLC